MPISPLKPWQWLMLALPPLAVLSFLLIAASVQIHQWGLSWLWAVFTLLFLGWRWLLVRWSAPGAVARGVQGEDWPPTSPSPDLMAKLPALEAHLQQTLLAARQDRPLWEDWPTFWQRCWHLVNGVAIIYSPQEKYPLLNLYIPSAYQLLKGTLTDLDRWMVTLTPTLNQVSLAQAYSTYETYQNLEPTLKKLLQLWNWSQWLLNPALALTRLASESNAQRAQTELLVNLSQLLRENILRNLAHQAISLYSNQTPEEELLVNAPLKAKSQTLKELMTVATTEAQAQLEQTPLQLLVVGRTGAGKSSLINSLFQEALAVTDPLPNTEDLQEYHWQTPQGEKLTLWDSPGYEQNQSLELRQRVLDYAQKADLVLLLNPALDPALQMDEDFLKDLKQIRGDLSIILGVTQVDRLRPWREWHPPYDWQGGNRPKEVAIREALYYRTEQLGDYCAQILPLVSGDPTQNRPPWGLEHLSLTLVEAIAPSQQIRLARFLAAQEARILAAAKIIERYTLQMATTQGLTAFLKSPVLKFISTLATGSPTLAHLLAEQIPVEQLPLAIGKLQMAYDLFSLLTEAQRPLNFDLPSLWPVIIENPPSSDHNAWALGQALVEYWTQNLSASELKERFHLHSAGS